MLIVGVRLVYDVPDDLRYRYSTVVFAVLVSAAQLGVVLMIARQGGLRGCSRSSHRPRGGAPRSPEWRSLSVPAFSS